MEDLVKASRKISTRVHPGIHSAILTHVFFSGDSSGCLRKIYPPKLFQMPFPKFIFPAMLLVIFQNVFSRILTGISMEYLSEVPLGNVPKVSPEFLPDVRPAIHTAVSPKGLPGPP